MDDTCDKCKFGYDIKPGGQRGIQMGKTRRMPCHVPVVGVVKVRHCVSCKKAKMLKPSGETPQLGNIWCEKKHAEINKQRNMECFE